MRTLSFAVALVLAASVAMAAELKSGLQTGAAIGAFDVVKCAGTESDGVKLGSQLCYRCKYGARPMVMVFTRNADKKLAMLAKRLDKAVTENTDKQLAAFISVLGDNREAAEAAAKELGAAGSENVPVVVPVEYENGPADYGINPDAEVTIILASNGKVIGNHAFAAAGDLTKESLKALNADMKKLVK